MSQPLRDRSDLIATLYRSSCNPALAEEAVALLCQSFSGCAAHVIVERLDAQEAPQVVTYGWSPEAIEEYFRHYAGSDPFLKEARARITERVILSQDILSTVALAETEIYRDFARQRTGAFHLLGARLMLATHVRLGVVVHRARDAPEFDELARTEMAQIGRHVRTALELSHQFQSIGLQASLHAAALDRCDHGAMIVDAEATLLYANAAAENLARSAGLVTTAHGKLRTATSNQTARLRQLLRAASSGGPGGAIKVQGRNETLALRVLPLPPILARSLVASPGTGALALIMLRRLSPAPPLNAQIMIELFRLTDAEAAILPALLSGATAQSVAASRGVTVPTIRTQVRGILEKTETQNLRSLATLVAGLGTLAG